MFQTWGNSGAFVWLPDCIPSFLTHTPPVVGNPPVFTEVPEDTHVFEMGGNPVTLILPCNASGSPTPTIAWFRNGTPVDAMFINDTLRSLVVENVMNDGEYASGNGVPYYCTATNAFGTIRSPTVRAFYSCKYCV